LDPTTVSLRAHRHADGTAVSIDLGDESGAAVTVTAAGWAATAESPVLFRRTTQTMPMPTPVRPESRGDGLARMRRLVHLPEPSWQLLVCWMVASFLHDIPRPILCLTGEQGTAKTSTARLIVDLVDPAAAVTGSPPRDTRSWLSAAKSRHVVCVDNVSAISETWSDALCRIVTGEAAAERALYSDDDVVIHRLQRAVIVTAIDVGSLKGDLAGRWLAIALDVIPPSARREEAELLAAWTDVRPYALADLLDLLSAVLGAMPTVRMAERPRLADYARVAAALDQVTGWATLPDFVARLDAAQAEVAAGDVFATAVIAWIGDGGEWSGTAAELATVVPAPDPRPRDWPTTPQAIGNRLRRVAPALRASGLTVETRLPDARGRSRVIHLAAPGVTSRSGTDAGKRGKRGSGTEPQVSGTILAPLPLGGSGEQAGNRSPAAPRDASSPAFPASAPLPRDGSGERPRRSEALSPASPLPRIGYAPSSAESAGAYSADAP
jgi:hypothetical protein